MHTILILAALSAPDVYDFTFTDGTEVHLEMNQQDGDTQWTDPAGVLRTSTGIDYTGDLRINNTCQMTGGQVLGFDCEQSRTEVIVPGATPKLEFILRQQFGGNRANRDLMAWPHDLNFPGAYRQETIRFYPEGGQRWQQEGFSEGVAITWPAGDTNGDRLVNFDDILKMLTEQRFEQPHKRAGWSDGDFDRNHVFDFDDILMVLAEGNYETGVPAAAVAVPEPSAWAICVMAAVACFLLVWMSRRGSE